MNQARQCTTSVPPEILKACSQYQSNYQMWIRKLCRVFQLYESIVDDGSCIGKKFIFSTKIDNIGKEEENQDTYLTYCIVLQRQVYLPSLSEISPLSFLAKKRTF